MIQALALLPPAINQTIQRVPLSPWSAAGFAVILAACAYLGARRSPWIAGVLALSVPFAGYRDVAMTTLTVPKCVAFGSAIGLLLSGISPWLSSQGARRLIVAGLLLLLAIAVSLVGATYPLLVAREFFKQAEYLVLAWCAAACVEKATGSQRFFVYGVLAASTIVASLALWQGLSGSAPSAVLINGHAVPRVTGTLEGPNQLAGFFESALPVLWMWPLLGPAWQPARNYGVAASWASLLLTQSRAGIVMAAISYALCSRIRLQAFRASLGPALAGACAGLLVIAVWFAVIAHAGWNDIGRFFSLDVSTEPGGVGLRSQLWPAALLLFSRHPLTGVGAGNFALLLPSAGVHGVQTQAGSLWLQTLAEQGVIGLGALVAFVWIVLRCTYARSRRCALAAAAFLAALSLFVHQLVDDLFFFPKVASLFWLLLGAGMATTQAPAPQGASLDES